MTNLYDSILFRNVSEEEFAFLKAREVHIIEEAQRALVYFERFTPQDLVRAKETGLSFDYIKEEKTLYLFFEKGKRLTPITNRLDFAVMSEFNRKVFSTMRDVLKESLEGEGLRRNILKKKKR